MWAVRLLDCWCPEMREEGGPEANDFTNEVLANADELYWHVPFSEDINIDGMNILKLPTFDRLLGYLYVGPTQTLNRMLVERGLASTTKHGKLGE